MRMPGTALPHFARRQGRRALAVLAVLACSTLVLLVDSLPAGQSSVLRSACLTLPLIQAEPAAAPTPADARGRQVLNQFLFRDRGQQVALQRARRDLNDGRTVEGLQHLQEIINQPGDAFLWNESRTQAVGARVEAARVIEALDGSTLKSYERLYGTEAKMLLKSARNSGDARQCAELIRLYYHTEAGFEAVNLQASRWFDHGQFRQAARAWEQLIANPVHKKRITDAIRFKASLAGQLSETPAEPDRLLAETGKRTAFRDGASIIPTEYVVRRLAKAQTADLERRGPVAALQANSSELEARFSPSSPYLQPLWTAPLAATRSEQLETAFRNWEKYREEQSLPIVGANTAIVIDDMLIVRDFKSVHAYDISSGQSLWTYACTSSLASAEQEIVRVHGPGESGRSRATSLVDFYAGNSTLGKLTSDGKLLFAVDFVEMSPAGYGESTTGNRAVRPKTSRLISRESNRLVAISLDARQSTGDRKPVWSVGGPVGAPNWFHRMDADDDGRVSPDEFVGTAAQFGAIDSNADGMLDRSEARGIGEQQQTDGVLAGHFFLGPPLAAGGRLYAVTESQRQLSLVALNAENGTLLWSQGIGYVDRPIDVDGTRYPISCTPSIADGIVICPTQLGFLVAADAETGTLLWAHDTSDDPLYTDGWLSTRQLYGAQGFPSSPLVLGNRLVVMPQQSLRVHCLDLWTGKPIWQSPREDGEYVAACDGKCVLVAGRQNCRGLSLEDGRQLWSSRVGTPCGSGLQSGPNYLLPLQEGRIATIHIGTGRQIGYSKSPALLADAPQDGEAESTARPWRPGNLAAGRDVVVSIGTQTIVAFPQTVPLLQEAYAELRRDEFTPESQLLAGELELVLGRLGTAHGHLSEFLSSRVSDEDRQRAEHLLREQLYLQLQTPKGDTTEILDELERFSRTPQERGRYLMQRVETQLQANEFAGVPEAIQEFAGLNLGELLPSVSNPQHLVAASSWIPSVIERVEQQFGPYELDELQEQFDGLHQTSMTTTNLESLRQLLAFDTDGERAAQTRTRLARLLISSGRFQEAESLLLQNRQCDDPAVVATATGLLIEIWDRAGLAEEAASLLAEMAEQYTDVELDDGGTGREFVAKFSQDSLTHAAYERLMSSDLPVARARISETRWLETNPELTNVYERFRRRLLTPQGSSFQLLDRTVPTTAGASGEARSLFDRNKSRTKLKSLLVEAFSSKFKNSADGSTLDGRLTVVNMQSGTIAGDILVPSNNSFRITNTRNSAHGHLFPLGSPAKMHGISLLDYETGQPAWTTSAQAIGPQRNAMRVGPYGPSYCTFQSGRHLIVVDPSCGKIRWQRGDLDPNSGLHDNSYTGLFGDEQVLVLFSQLEQTYTVFRTATGEIVRQGRLDADTRQPQRAFGRKLQYCSRTAGENHLKIWDPLDDRHVLDLPVPDRVLTQITDDNELAVILPPDRVYVLDVVAGKVRLDLNVDPAALNNLQSVQVFSDHDRYYLNLQRLGGTSGSMPNVGYLRDRYVSAVNIKGDLYAVDRKSAKILWKRVEPERSILQTPNVRLPFLIAMSTLGGSWNGNSDATIIEVIHATTGETIAGHEGLTRDYIMQFGFDPKLHRVELRGKRTTIHIDFFDQPLAIPDVERPL